jgi:hypothetical protein
MLNPTRLLATKPAQDHLKLLAGPREPIHATPIIQHTLIVASNIHCITTGRVRGRQDFHQPARKLRRNGCRGRRSRGHPFVVDVDISNADLRHPLLLLLPAYRRPRTQNRAKTPPATATHPRNINKSGESPTLYESRTHWISTTTPELSRGRPGPAERSLKDDKQRRAARELGQTSGRHPGTRAPKNAGSGRTSALGGGCAEDPMTVVGYSSRRLHFALPGVPSARRGAPGGPTRRACWFPVHARDARQIGRAPRRGRFAVRPWGDRLVPGVI